MIVLILIGFSVVLFCIFAMFYMIFDLWRKSKGRSYTIDHDQSENMGGGAH